MAPHAVPAISSPRRGRGSWILSTLFILVFAASFFIQPEAVKAATGCASSTPSSGEYTVTLCFSTPSDGGTLVGNVTVTPTITVTGTNPGVQQVIYSIRGAYLLTAFQSPYTFTLNSALFVDGAAGLTFVTQMRDGYTTVNPASINVTLNNGVTSPPVNTNHFTPTLGTTPPPGSPFVVAAAGDGAGGETNSLNVSNLISSINPNLFLYLGDVYQNGSLTEFNNWYGSGTNYFSKFNAITDPTVGNHEYTGSQAPGYFFYWNNVPNYYSYNTGGWHFISLNANNSRVPAKIGSAQYNWLAADLAANTLPCILVYYHEPFFNVGPEGSETGMSDAWKLFAQDKVTLVLNGHDHDYQRWTAMDGNGNPNPNGVTEFVVGTAGHGIQTFQTTDSRMLVGYDSTNKQYGVLTLNLNSGGVDFKFINTSSVVKDSGNITCKSSGPDTTPPSIPANLQGNAVSATQVNLTWSASTDNVGVNGYTIYRNGSPIGTVSGATLSYSDTTALPSTSYAYTVDAFDAAGNHSNQSDPADVITPALPASITFTAVADSYTDSSHPTTNHGTATTFRTDASPIENSYIRFTVSGLAGSQVVSAQLRVFTNSSSSTGFKVGGVSDNTWGETTINYNNAPSIGATLNSSGMITSGTWVTIDVSPWVTGEGQLSFGLSTTSTSGMSFASRESGANAPQLIVNLPGSPTSTPTPSNTPTNTPTPTKTATPTKTLVNTPTATNTPVNTPTPTNTPVNTPTPTTTPVNTPTPTNTPVNTPIPTATLSGSSTLNPVADAYVNASNPTTNYGTSKTLYVDNSPIEHSYVKFNVTGLSGAPSKVTLKIFANSTSTTGFDLYSVSDNSWTETGINYSNAPAFAGTKTGSSGAIKTSGQFYSVDVTSLVAGNGQVSFGLLTTSSTAINLSSRESGADAPQLVITP